MRNEDVFRLPVKMIRLLTEKAIKGKTERVTFTIQEYINAKGINTNSTEDYEEVLECIKEELLQVDQWTLRWADEDGACYNMNICGGTYGTEDGELFHYRFNPDFLDIVRGVFF